MRALVLDASACIESLSHPERAGAAVAGYDVCAPTLLRWEVGNVLHGRHAARFGDLAARHAMVRALLAPVRLVDQAGREEAIGACAAEAGLTFYDAAYLVLARDEGALLLTEDAALLRAGEAALGKGKALPLARLPTGKATARG